MSNKPNTYETKNGPLLTKRKYNVREESGIKGERTLKLQFTDAEMVPIMASLKLEVFDNSEVEAAWFKHLTGQDIGRAPRKDAVFDKAVKVISKALESGSVNAENFEERLVAYADKTKLSESQVEKLRDKFSTTKKVEDDIDF